MTSEKVRAEILVNGLVQGVGFRYFVVKHAVRLKLHGFVQNLFTGEVHTVVEGDQVKVEEFINLIKLGPAHAQVKNSRIDWSECKNEFESFEVKY
jgi:acylphosphatase